MEYLIDGDIGRKLYFYGDFERNELEICRRYVKNTSTVIDIGANIGLHTIFFASLARDGLVVSFEPQARTFSRLVSNVKGMNNVLPVNVAVSSRESIAAFYIACDDAYSSLKDTHRKNIVRKSNVLTLPFDLLLPVFDNIDFIKIDVEGFEHEVLLSMQQTLQRHRPVLFVEIYSGVNSNPEPNKTVMFLKNIGYRAYFVDGNGNLEEYVQHNDRFYNYFFVHSNSECDNSLLN